MVSIIVPIYNTEQYLRKCIESILNQTYKNLEIILINDGSIDKSGLICDEYAYSDSRINVIHNVNSGVSAARNIGLDNASGKYITFVDSDDYIEKNYIETLVNAIEINNAELAICGIKEIKGNNIKNRVVRGRLTGIFFEDYYSIIDFLCVPFSKIFLREIIEKYAIRFNTELQYAEDEIFNIGYYQYVTNYAFTERALYVYNHRLGTLSDKEKLRNKKQFYNYLKKLSIQKNIFDKLPIKKKEQIIGEQIIRAIRDFSDTDNYKEFKNEVFSIKKYLYKTIKYNSVQKVIFILLLKLKFYLFLFYLIKFKNIKKDGSNE